MGARAGGGAGFRAIVSVAGANGQYHYLSKDFKSQSKAEDWVDKVATKFNWKNNAGVADSSTTIKVENSGYEDVIGGRDFGPVWKNQMAKEFHESTKP